MNKNTIIDTIKYNYVNEFKSLGYNLTKEYPIKWDKDYFIDSVEDAKKILNHLHYITNLFLL